MHKLALPLLLFVCLAVAMSGCVKAEVKGASTVNPTLAEQMADLQQARGQGAISDAEYQLLQQRIQAAYAASPSPKGAAQ